ncbi:hypothetical protein CVD28_01625 [Bacillus sp. M6-12]|uniref:hypothetical protein n=1 Tax=Bacillus sp. M6-12 TaxID=2054166 RepID=UPI000C76DF57|nr:hypothetical protein [Bacillus sp. M6-12]PLS19133.1 hypothetical protein CVD28_01625 [Bacillus sp. M6-12]
MNVVETLLNGDKIFRESIDKFFSTTFYHKQFSILIDLKSNGYSEGEKIEAINVSFYDRAVNKLKHLKVYETSKGLYFNAYGTRVYLNDMIRKW